MVDKLGNKFIAGVNLDFRDFQILSIGVIEVTYGDMNVNPTQPFVTFGISKWCSIQDKRVVRSEWI